MVDTFERFVQGSLMPSIKCRRDLEDPSGDVLQEENGKFITFNTKTPFSTHLVILYLALFVQSWDETCFYLRLSICFLLLLFLECSDYFQKNIRLSCTIWASGLEVPFKPEPTGHEGLKVRIISF
ncbi:hypothetical protein DSECCO2_238220 [anaerobic digester metagenome]